MYKDTIVIVNYEATADFDRMYPEYGNMLDAKKKADRAIREYISRTTERATRKVETVLGMSTMAYEQKRGE
jgi:hypothetical protein